MFHLHITKSWILSTVASRVYLVCAVLAMALFGTLIATFLAVAVSGLRSLADVPSALVLVRVLILPEVFGTATLSIAMWYFWFTFDRSSWLKKALWFPPLYLLPTMGPALYYFFVYRRQSPSSEGATECSPGRKPWVPRNADPSPEATKETISSVAVPPPVPG